MDFARVIYGDKRDKGADTLYNHVCRVVVLVAKHNLLFIVALLHDVVEDTDVELALVDGDFWRRNGQGD